MSDAQIEILRKRRSDLFCDDKHVERLIFAKLCVKNGKFMCLGFPKNLQVNFGITI